MSALNQIRLWNRKRNAKACLVMVGGFPPPVRGMPMVNKAVYDEFQREGVSPLVVDLAASSLDRSLKARLGRLPKVLRGLLVMGAVRRMRSGTLYISISDGFGQLYELAFVVLARVRNMKMCLHHHSFMYLDRPSRLTGVLTKAAGRSAVHVTQSPVMGDRLKMVYRVDRVVAVSNAVFFWSGKRQFPAPRTRLKTLGFISNISAEKGVFEFLDLVAAALDVGLPLQAILAGPFQDIKTETQVRARLAKLPAVEYLGPTYGTEKDTFFAGIDVLVFPTRYANETEGIVNHEAMSRAIPAIAYGRGCIPEIVGSECGLVVDPGEYFVPVALAQIEAWHADPRAFEAASHAAAVRFAKTYEKSQSRWRALLRELIENSLGACAVKTENSST